MYIQRAWRFTNKSKPDRYTCTVNSYHLLPVTCKQTHAAKILSHACKHAKLTGFAAHLATSACCRNVVTATTHNALCITLIFSFAVYFSSARKKEVVDLMQPAAIEVRLQHSTLIQFSRSICSCCSQIKIRWEDETLGWEDETLHACKPKCFHCFMLSLWVGTRLLD